MYEPMAAPALAILLSISPAWARGESAAPAAALGLAPEALAESASASWFGRKGSVSLGAERLFGLTSASPSSGSSITTISLLGGSGVEVAATPYSIPRIGVDYFPTDGFSFGLGAELASISVQSSSEIILGLNPRLGYALRLTDSFSLWPRAGITYMHASPFQGPSSYLLALSLEVQIVMAPLRHFGFLLGPVVDVGLAATQTKVTQIGLQAGLVGWF